MYMNTVCTSKQDVWISKTLSWILRHGALKQGLTISSDGFIALDQILSNSCFKGKCTVDDIKRVVANNNKQRFALRTNLSGKLEIRANQGHSISNLDNLELTPITDINQVENVIHGTYLAFWESIKLQGLFRGSRNDIHFAGGLLSNRNIISGLRKTAEIYIYINLPKALSFGLLFFLSANGVILSPGDDDGYIKPEFFLKVVCASDNLQLSF